MSSSLRSSTDASYCKDCDMTLFLKQGEAMIEMQRDRFDALLRPGNNCAHPKEAVNASDFEALKVQKLELPLQIVAVEGFLSPRIV